MDYRNLDLNLLLALDALLSERNVTRAARRLNISQPALSAKLARLRRLFDDELMIPTSRGVLPTALALELQEPIRQVLDGARGIVSRGQSFDATTSDMTFCIAASDYMQIAVLLPFLNSLNSHPPASEFCSGRSIRQPCRHSSHAAKWMSLSSCRDTPRQRACTRWTS